MKKLVVLISGNGTNLKSILDSCSNGYINGHVVAVLSNNISSYGLILAEKAGIKTKAFNIIKNDNCHNLDYLLIKEIDIYHPDLIILAGYMKILSKFFINRYYGRILNIHPSLLPKYPGLHTHRKVLKNRDTVHGSTVHFVTDVLDSGPIILQAKIPVFSNDTELDISMRVKNKEHIIYPRVINWFTKDRLIMKEEKAWLDGKQLPEHGLLSY